jgi:hypothetical protein
MKATWLFSPTAFHGFLGTALAVFLVGAASIAPVCARESVIALGMVDENGVLARSANSVEGVVQSSRSGEGQYTVTVISAGAFAGTTEDRYLAELSVRGLASNDNLVNGNVISVTDDVLTVQIRASDVEDAANPNNALPQDTRFFFAIRRIDPGIGAFDGDSRYFVAAGSVTSSGNPVAVLGIDRIVVTTANLAPGEYTIRLTKAGAFAGDAVTDYLIFLTPNGGGGVTDEAVRGAASAVISDDSVLFEVYTDDVQQDPPGNGPVPQNRPFQFAIYRIEPTEASGLPRTRVVAAAASIDSSGNLVAGGTRLGRGTLASSRVSPGLYRLDLVSPGAFAGVLADRFAVTAFNHGLVFQDELVGASVAVVDENTLRVSIGLTDVQTAGENTGVLSDGPVTVVLHDLDPGFGPDLAIGARPSPGALRGAGTRNANGVGQRIRLDLTGTRTRKFFFASENAAHVFDGTRLTGLGAGGRLKSTFFRTTGGRTNVTAIVRTGGLVAEAVRPGVRIRFEGRLAYRSASSRPTRMVRLIGRSDSDLAEIDLVNARVVPR